MDDVIVAELESVALSVRSSWSRDDARAAERMILGEEIGDHWEADDGPVEVFGDDRARRNFLLRSELFETRRDTAGPVHQELARALLDRGHYRARYPIRWRAWRMTMTGSTFRSLRISTP